MVRRPSRRSTLSLALLLAAASSAAAAPPATAVDIAFPTEQESAPYTPNQVEISPGDSVTFNGGFDNHPLRWLTSDFTKQSSGTTRTYAFPNPGMYRFICDIHSDMTGFVRVDGNVFTPAEFTVSPAAPVVGQTVRFDASALVDPGGPIASYEWDLDGDGAFGTKGPAATATKTFTRAGTVKVGLRYVDNGHETSPTFTRDIVVTTAPAGGGGGTVGGGGGGAGGSGTDGGTGAGGGTSADSRAPKVALTLASKRTIKLLAGVARVGLRLDEAASVTATVKRGPLTLGRGTAKLKRGAGVVRVRLSRIGLRRVRPRLHTKVTLVVKTRDAAGNTRTSRRNLTITR